MTVKTLLKWLGLAALGVLVLMMTFPDVLLVPFTLLFGWVNSLRRLGSRWSVSPATLGLILTALLVLLAGTHWFFAWLRARARPGDGGAPSAPSRPWPWRWTLSLHAGFWLTVLAIVSLVCITHQVFWMVVSKEPVFVSRGWPVRARADLHRAAQALVAAGDAHHWDPVETRAAVWQDRAESAGDRSALWERHHLVLLPAPDGRLAIAVVMPREPKARSKVGLAVVTPDAEVQYQPADALPQILARAEGPATGAPAKPEERR
jgi:hypothetical protein